MLAKTFSRIPRKHYRAEIANVSLDELSGDFCVTVRLLWPVPFPITSPDSLAPHRWDRRGRRPRAGISWQVEENDTYYTECARLERICLERPLGKAVAEDDPFGLIGRHVVVECYCGADGIMDCSLSEVTPEAKLVAQARQAAADEVDDPEELNALFSS